MWAGGAQTNHADNYSYDASGNMTNDGENTLVYDAENRVTSSSGTSGSGTYSYDGNGLRVQKVAGSTTTVYIFSGAKVIAEYVNGALPTSPAREYVYAGGALLVSISGSITTYYHQDHLSNRLVTDSTGAVVENLGTYPYGESWYNTSSDKWLFTSYERDSESGNDYAMARYYVNRFGRFLSTDPLSGSATDPQTLNHYSYTRNDPINAADPTGMVTYPYFYGYGGFGGGGRMCQVDGLDTPCFMAGATVASGGGVNIGSVELYLTGGIPVPGSAYDPNDPTNPNLIFGDDGTISIEAGLPVGTYSDSWQESATYDMPQSPSVTQSPQTQRQPWYKNSCVTGALGKGALSAGIDAIGLIPEAGGIARVIGHEAGYVGVVADQVGSGLINAVGKTASAGQGLVGLSDTSPTGLISTGLTVAGFIPGPNDVAAGLSIGWDIFRTAKAIGACY